MNNDFPKINQWFDSNKEPFIIAGPCSVETPEQIHKIALDLSQTPEVSALRAGVWKPRTRPNSFEGIGEIALPWLQEVRKSYKIPICIEVATPHHVELALKHDIDFFWIGARTTANPFSVQALADSLKGVKIPVLVKNPINADLALWIGALERLSQAGIGQLGAIHRGFSQFKKGFYRNPPMWEIPMELKRRIPELPLLCDPSHITGKREDVGRAGQKAMDLNMDGLMIETHPTPEKAWSDAAQQITPATLREILKTLSIRHSTSKDQDFEGVMSDLRSNIDQLDKSLIEILSQRKSIVKKIARAKFEHNVTPLQISRLDQILKERKSWGDSLDLHSDYIVKIFDTIHEQSIRTQTDFMRELEKEEKKK